MPKKTVPPIAELQTPEDAKKASDLVDAAVDRFDKGSIDDLEQASGMYMVGRHVGWKVLVLIHNKRTIRKYEEILGISIREEFPEVGPAADRSVGYKIAKTVSNFWKAVSGEISIENRRMVEKG